MRIKVAIPEPHSSKLEYNERSTTYYETSLRAAGLEPVIIFCRATPEEAARVISDCGGILLPGSPADVAPQKYGAKPATETCAADPLRDNLDELLLQDAYNLRKPIFGICYGMQILNVWRGGSLIQHLATAPVDHQPAAKPLRAHEVQLEPESLLARLAAASIAPVNSSHHQAVEVPGDGLRVTARSPLDDVIEAVEGTARGHWVMGVQWHPERSCKTEDLSVRLFEEFAAAVRAWAPRVITESVARG